MKLVKTNLEQAAGAVFKALSGSKAVSFQDDPNAAIGIIRQSLEDDLKMEEEIEEQADQEIQKNELIAHQSDLDPHEIKNKVKRKYAELKGEIVGSGDDRIENQSKKICKALWTNDEIDFFEEDYVIVKIIFTTLTKYLSGEDDLIKEAERIANTYKKVTAYSPEWYILVEKHIKELRAKRGKK